jgi:hypothetical protein
MMATIEGRSVDRVPVHHLQFSGHAARVILGREAYVGGAFLQWKEIQALWAGPDAHAEFKARCETDAVDVACACGHDLLRLRYWRWPKDQKPVRRIDEHTFLFGDPDGQWYTMTYRPTLELLTQTRGPAPAAPGPADRDGEITKEELAEQVEAAEGEAETCRSPAGSRAKLAAAIAKYPDWLLKVGGPTVCVNMLKLSELTAAALYPELFARLLRARARRYAKDVPPMAAAGMQVNFAGMDFCSKDGPCISPDMFRRIVLPALKRLVDACHEAGMRYFYGSDGNFWPVAAEMFEGAGVDGWFEVDKSAGMDLRALRRRFPRATLVGNIPVQVLHRGTVADVEREVMDCLAAAHELGGIVVGASNLIMPGTPAENILTMLRLIEDNR